MTRSPQLNFIDIFSGAGGLSCGLEMAGHKCLLGIDSDKLAIETFLHNHRHAKSYCDDIHNLDAKMLKELTDGKEIHMVVGGPPCQGFSTVGRGNPKDARNNLFMQFLRIVETLNPQYLVIENVTGLLAKKNEKTLSNIFKKFHSIGYNIDVKVLSAQNYGVPEKRRRTIFIGSRVNKSIIFPKITHDIFVKNKYIPPINIGDAFSDLKNKKNEYFNHDLAQAKLKTKLDEKRLKKIPEGKGIRYQRDELAYLTPSLYLDVDWENMRENRFRQTKYLRLDRSSTSPTIMTHRHNYFHPTDNRYLTQREAAKLQSFPNDFYFCGTITSQWRQIGNAVPPLLGKAIGKAINLMVQKRSKPGESSKLSLKDILKSKNEIKDIRKNAFSYTRKKNAPIEKCL